MIFSNKSRRGTSATQRSTTPARAPLASTTMALHLNLSSLIDLAEFRSQLVVIWAKQANMASKTTSSRRAREPLAPSTTAKAKLPSSETAFRAVFHHTTAMSRTCTVWTPPDQIKSSVKATISTISTTSPPLSTSQHATSVASWPNTERSARARTSAKLQAGLKKSNKLKGRRRRRRTFRRASVRGPSPTLLLKMM